MAKKKMTMKEIRIKKNLGKTETAKAAGMTPEEYERAEEHPRRLNGIKAYHIAKALGVKLDDIDFQFEDIH